MKSSGRKVLYGIIGILGAAAAVLPLMVYHCIEMADFDPNAALECHTADQSGMVCHSAVVAAAVTGIVIAALVIVVPFLLKIANIAVSALMLAGGIAVYAVPRVVPLCSSARLACRYLTKPVLTSLGSTIILLSLALIAVQLIMIRKAVTAAE